MVNTKLAYEETFDCVQCGYCLPACPTYLSMGKETHSPRGRINLVKMAAEGALTYDELEGPIDLCLGCRACEVVCPTNVQYGKILASAKEVIQNHKKESGSKRSSLFQAFMFDKALPNKKLGEIGATGLTFYQKSGMQKVIRKSGAINVLPENLRTFEKILPKTEGPITRNKRKAFYPAKNEPIYRIGYFTGCMMDTMFSSINTQAIKLLQKAGCEVTIIKEQTCCGALQNHSGETETTRRLAKENIMAFENYEFDYIVNSIGGCGAQLIEYDQLFEKNDPWQERAREFVEQNVDISVILGHLNLVYEKEINKVVTYQPSCHMSNVQKRVQEPLELLKSVPGIQYLELPQKDMCCGSAGIYNIVHYKAAMEILDEKMSHIKVVSPQVIITTNPGCHLQMKVGVEEAGLSDQIQVVHIVELLAEACGMKD